MLELSDSSGIVFFNAVTKEIVTVETTLEIFKSCILETATTPDELHRDAARQLVEKGFLVTADG